MIFLLFLWAGSTLRPIALRALTKVAASSGADLVNYFFRVTHETDPTIKRLSQRRRFWRHRAVFLPLRPHRFAAAGSALHCLRLARRILRRLPCSRA